MRINALLATAALALSLGAAPALADDWDCDNPDRNIEITNGSNYVITGIDIYNDSQLGEDEANLLDDVLYPGDSVSIYADPAGEYHTYIVDVTGGEEDYIASARVDACQFGAGWYITDNDFTEDTEGGDY